MIPDYRAERLAELRATAADRPAHLRFAEEVIRLHEEGRDEDEWPSEASRIDVMPRVQEAIEDDVTTAYLNTAGFGRYAEIRRSARRTARESARTRQRRAVTLEELLQLDGSSELQ